ncbi:hypothetical protein BRADI_5g27077v3, partial [Brachypodium distachyon]
KKWPSSPSTPRPAGLAQQATNVPHIYPPNPNCPQLQIPLDSLFISVSVAALTPTAHRARHGPTRRRRTRPVRELILDDAADRPSSPTTPTPEQPPSPSTARRRHGRLLLSDRARRQPPPSSPLTVRRRCHGRRWTAQRQVSPAPPPSLLTPRSAIRSSDHRATASSPTTTVRRRSSSSTADLKPSPSPSDLNF